MCRTCQQLVATFCGPNSPKIPSSTQLFLRRTRRPPSVPSFKAATLKRGKEKPRRGLNSFSFFFVENPEGKKRKEKTVRLLAPVGHARGRRFPPPPLSDFWWSQSVLYGKSWCWMHFRVRRAAVIGGTLICWVASAISGAFLACFWPWLYRSRLQTLSQWRSRSHSLLHHRNVPHA